MATQNKIVKRTEEYEYPGKNPTKKTYEYPPNKTISDWVTLFSPLIGVVIAAAAVLVSVYTLTVRVNQFNAQQKTNAQMQAAQVAVGAAQTLDQERESILDTYLDRMSDLLLMDHLSTSKSGDEVRALAIARIDTALQNLDGNRRGTLVHFLLQAGLDSFTGQHQLSLLPVLT